MCKLALEGARQALVVTDDLVAGVTWCHPEVKLDFDAGSPRATR